MIYLLLGLALLFDFLNGFHDSSNIVATVISSRALKPRVALLLAALAHFAGPFLFGLAVAKTIGDGLLDTSALSLNVVLAALISAILWNAATWYFGLPSSSSHALIGGLLGGAVLTNGLEVILVSGLIKIILVLLFSPLLGMIVGFIIMRITLWAVRKATPKVNIIFKRLQIATLIGLALSHGTNDAQKTMGVITLGLVLMGILDTFAVPDWVVVICAGAIALGTALGGWRLIRTLGGKLFRIRPIHGFTSQMAGASVILGAALLGGPVSTTQVMSSTILGVGAGQRMSMVRWQVLKDMATTWLLTIPLTAAMSAVSLLLLNRFL
ncbi:MAG: inorganic phosphate transporter [Anaerolineales bacterium]|nr:inorganic phosphate transporter [Anaerolineales bacterium]